MKFIKLIAVFFLPTYVFANSNLLPSQQTNIDLQKVFTGSPIIYSVLILMSVISLSIWFYSLLSWKESFFLPESFIKKIRKKIKEEQFEEAMLICENHDSYIASVIACGISCRHQGAQMILSAMEAEGQRLGLNLWQRISILHDIATTAPMLGLLGTVLGLFYAFYDTQRNLETISALFDGLGIAIGTTVAGLIVAIMAMIFHTTLKIKLTRLMASLEAEALDISALFKN